ncbi:hypothetical protein KC19_2G252100 [Ceratodon purpureus]|uniref:Uncharacterized protein n=1 Tax=Ceratodon purpureus TaxID=3225 RepID=A0A8T0J0A5_CERPU|nr:hypothetical protein KC19_2G252100 [Ceratodon purpureus]
MMESLREATVNFEFYEMRAERRWEDDMVKALTMMKGASKDDKQHQFRETEAMKKIFEAQSRESLQAWILLEEHQRVVKVMKDAVNQLKKHVVSCHRNFDHHVEDLVRETRKAGGTTREAMRIAGLVCDYGGANYDFLLNVEERHT